MESHPDCDWTPGDYYRQDVNSVNREFDKKLENKPFFVSKKSIEKDRSAALKRVEEDHYPKTGWGGFSDY